MLVLITGDFGVGKDTFADYLLENLEDSIKIPSYTSREPRYEGENTHTFATKEDFIKDYDDKNIIAWTMIHNEYYWTTKQQFGKHKHELYIVDDIGLRDVIKSHFFDDYIVIEIIRSEHLIHIDEQRKNRKRMKKVDCKKYINLTILNDGSLTRLYKIAEHIASCLE